MENEKTILSDEMAVFVDSLKTIIQKQFGEGFKRETAVYSNFLESYKQAFENYYLGYINYKEDKHSGNFLHNNIQLHSNLKDALEANFDKNEALHFGQFFESLNFQILELFKGLYANKEGGFYRQILKSEEEQFNRKPFLIRQFLKLKYRFRKSEPLIGEDTIHSFSYFFYHQCVGVVLENNKAELFNFYEHLANLNLDFWKTFENNTAFVKRLHSLDYVFESLETDDLAWELDNLPEIKFKELNNAFNDFCIRISSEIEDKITNFDFSSFIDIKRKFLDLNAIKTKIQTDLQKEEKSNVLWRTTRFALTEDYGFDLEIYLLKYKIAKKKLDFIHSVDSIFKQPFDQKLDEFESQFDYFLNDLDKESGKKFINNPHESLRKLKLQLKKELLVKSLPQIRDYLNGALIIKEIDDFETMIHESFVLSKTRLLMKNPNFTRKVKPGELEAVSPDDLIAFEIKPSFIKVFSAFKRSIIEHFQNVLNEIEAAPSITFFSVESASQHFREQKNHDEVIQICVEGINRSKTKIQETRTNNHKFFETEIEKFKTITENLVVSLTEITNNESAFQIKVRIVKAIAIARTKAIKDKIITSIINFLPKILEWFKQTHLFVNDSIQKISKQFALEKQKGFIATDISDYLSNTKSTIAKLPYIYQRLFSFEPLETFELYIERKDIMDKIELAYSKWKEEKFAPVVIVGEKGSGKTSFINKFLKSRAVNESVIKFDLLELNQGPEELYNRILENAQLKEVLPGDKKIVVIDGFERLYESKINGFEYILKLFKKISDTQKEVFWIVAVHSISWNFFDKSVAASDYFGYHISMNNLNFDELNELIKSRHKLSGYPLQFAERERKKSFLGHKTIDPAEQQEILRKEYFNELNKNVQGNILQTFIYWMRSANLIENKTILIESETNLDFNFVRSIRADKLIILKNVLIHNGLDIKRLAKILRVEIPQMELQVQQLIDDSILTVSNGVFFITPVIYKQIIKHLQNINLLH